VFRSPSASFRNFAFETVAQQEDTLPVFNKKRRGTRRMRPKLGITCSILPIYACARLPRSTALEAEGGSATANQAVAPKGALHVAAAVGAAGVPFLGRHCVQKHVLVGILVGGELLVLRALHGGVRGSAGIAQWKRTFPARKCTIWSWFYLVEVDECRACAARTAAEQLIC
jgi:hypothetical protein